MLFCFLPKQKVKKLWEIVSPFYKRYRWKKDGELALCMRRRKLRGESSVEGPTLIALVLFYLRSSANLNTIAIVFGTPPTTIHYHIVNGLLLLETALANNEETKIQWPTIDEMKHLCVIGASKYPRLRNYKIWGFMDGFKSNTMRPKNDNVQSANYSGYVGKHCVNNVLLMDVLGKIRFAKLANCGNCVDSVAAARGGYYDLAKQAYLAGGFNVLVDSAFRLGYGTIATNNALLDISGNPSHLVSMRQSAECAVSGHPHSLRSFIAST
eukprot:g4341.t1